MDEKHRILQQYFGYKQFRTGQEDLIDALLAGRDALGIMPTGGGKSICYQIPALMMEGITLVVSPLISLMHDQVMALKKVGIPGAYINSSLTPGQIQLVYRRLALGNYKIVYVAPERLLTPGFLQALSRQQLAMVAVDEAHCISQWGQDFRPSYLRILEFLQGLPRRPVVAAFTATATPQVRQDILKILALREPFQLVTGFDRPNLSFGVLRPRDKWSTLVELVGQRAQKSGIIYCSTRRDVEEVCDGLKELGYGATRYHGGLSEEERQANQTDFVFDRSPIMVATNAFGMGIDKSNVSYVIHYSMPTSLEGYYQEAGRAGRDGSEGECVLLYAPRDVHTARFLIEHPRSNDALTPQEAQQILEQDRRRLSAMVNYCNSKSCLRGYILDYFGQDSPHECGHCSSCLRAAAQSGAARAPSARPKKMAGQPLFVALKTLRMELSMKEHLPPYMIFTDATLREMAEKQPRTTQELLEVSGVGKYKANLYGPAFLEVIRSRRGKPE